MPHPWELQPGESAKAFAAFVIYRDMQARERSQDAAYRWHTGRPDGPGANGLWQKWSADNRWPERAAAYDAYLDEQRRRAREERLRQLEERRVDFEIAHQDRLERRVVRIEENLDRADKAPVTDVVKVEIKPDGTRIETKVKGFNLSGYARLSRESRDVAKDAILGVRPQERTQDAEAAPAETPGAGGGGEFVWVKPEPEGAD